MARAENILKRLRDEFQQKYNPRTAYGDKELIALVKRAEEIQEWIDNTEECPNCDGEGEVPHDCGCELCSARFEDCPKCLGEGRLAK